MNAFDNLNGETAFTTKRLTCRRWLPTDEDAIYRVYSDPVSARWVDDGQPITHDECAAWLDVTAGNYAIRGYGMFALQELSSGTTLGFCGLVHPGNQPEAEIKYAFLRSRWGEGLASEVVPAMVSYGAGVHSLAEIIATVAAQNGASQRVLLKSGFRWVEGYCDGDGDTRRYTWSVSGQ